MAKSSTDYPRGRPPFFALRYGRLLAKSGAGENIGPTGVAICLIVAMYEDAKRYTAPATFFNSVLQGMLGIAKWETLSRARDKAVEAGWLQFQTGGRKRSPGRYWVVIPDGFNSIPDGSADEGGTAEERAYSDGYRDGYEAGSANRLYPFLGDSSPEQAEDYTPFSDIDGGIIGGIDGGIIGGILLPNLSLPSLVDCSSVTDPISDESEFATMWNALPSTSKVRHALPNDLRKDFRMSWGDPEWKPVVLRALERLKAPLPNGRILKLRTFLQQSQLQEFADGTHGWLAPQVKAEETKKPRLLTDEEKESWRP